MEEGGEGRGRWKLCKFGLLCDCFAILKVNTHFDVATIRVSLHHSGMIYTP